MARIDPEKKAAGARWLAEGKSAAWVGRWCGVSTDTVRRWKRTDPEFQRVLQQHVGGLYGRGLQLAADRGVRITVSGKSRTGAADLVRDVLVDMARKDARRKDGGRDIYQEES